MFEVYLTTGGENQVVIDNDCLLLWPRWSLQVFTVRFFMGTRQKKTEL